MHMPESAFSACIPVDSLLVSSVISDLFCLIPYLIKLLMFFQHTLFSLQNALFSVPVTSQISVRPKLPSDLFQILSPVRGQFHQIFRLRRTDRPI